MDINITAVDREQALRYMACGSTEDEALMSCLDECESRLIKCLRPRFIYRYFPLDTDNFSLKGCAMPLEGNDIREHLTGCSGAVLTAVTAGAEADRLIRQLEREDTAKAFITDAMASAAAEQAADAAEDIIMTEINRLLGGEKYYTWRFSPGYGDFPLELQKKLLDAVDAPRKIGLCAGSSSMLSPVKSVTAVTGVSDAPLPKKRRGCSICSMKETCAFRKRGDHCGY